MSFLVNPILVVENTPRRFRAGRSRPCSRMNGDGRLFRRLVFTDDPKRFVARVECLDTPDDNALEWIMTGWSQFRFARTFLCRPGQLVIVQVVPGHRPYKIRPRGFAYRLQSIRMRNMLFCKMRLIVRYCNVETLVGHQPPLVEGVFL